MLLSVDNMSCQHCVSAITRALQALDADARVLVDLAGKTVQVDGDITPDAVLAALLADDYPATLIEGG